MPIFHKPAYLTAYPPEATAAITRLTDAYFEDDALLEEALRWLNAQQFCDHCTGGLAAPTRQPGSPLQLQVRNLVCHLAVSAIQANP
jgi:hypothetical protein